MTKKKKTAPQHGNASQDMSTTAPSPSPPPPPLDATSSSSLSTTNKTAKSKQPPEQHSSPALIICRNKHWRFISSFHGPWLQLPPEILETLANMNYNTPRPRPIDPAVFFDIVKIRRLVDEATNLAVRAATGVASIGQSNAGGSPHYTSALGLGFGYGPGGQTKLSRERKQKMRESATQKLAKAYRLDEIACSVATMQSASALEEVAAHVLQRNPQDLDAIYVHFFHEKIPSRQLAESTSLGPLNTIIASRPNDPEPLRTRAIVRIFKGDFDGAVSDLKKAIDCNRPRSAHPDTKEVELFDRFRNGRRQDDVILKEEEQPTSLDIQLLFQKANVHLTIACRNVNAAFPPPGRAPVTQTSEDRIGTEQKGEDLELSSSEKEEQRKVAAARKLVRSNAKRALRDLTAFLSHFEYSPDLPIHIAEDFTHRATSLANGHRVPRTHAHSPQPGSPVSGSSPYHSIYKLSELFAASPPSGLPPYPSMELAPARSSQQLPSLALETTTETLTFHPLLADALHSLLLCHCLVQTSAKELLRHSYMVARLSRLADGYPIFQASRSPARADWIEVLRGGSNWINLAGTWEDLCAPAPLPLFQPASNGGGPVPVSLSKTLPSAKQAKALQAAAENIALPSSPSSTPAPVRLCVSATEKAAQAEKARRELIHHQAVLDSLNDERVTDESSFQLAIRARKLRAERDYRLDNAVAALDAKLTRRELEAPPPPPPPDASASDATTSPVDAAPSPVDHTTDETPRDAVDGNSPPKSPLPAPAAAAAPPRRRSADDAARDYSISTDRAMAVTRWVLEAPPNAGLESGDGTGGTGGRPRRKKKRPGPGVESRLDVVGALGELMAPAMGAGGH